MVGLQVTRGNTGRISPQWESEDLNDSANQVHLLTAWLDHEQFGRPLSAGSHAPAHVRRAAQQAISGLKEELRLAREVALGGPLFRGRAGPAGPPPSDFGPPPVQGRNRFNAPGQRALYVARTHKTIQAELGQHGPVPEFWVQRFDVDLPRTRVLMLTPAGTDGLRRLHQLMALSERPYDATTMDAYVATILLRDLSEEAGFDAIAYPTVHGPYVDDENSVNVVIISDEVIAEVLRSPAGSPVHITP